MPKVFDPTSEQRAIVDAFVTELAAPAHARKHLVINAGAGTGKTSTLRLISERATSSSGLYLAFNRSVAESAAKAFGSNVECLTTHSLAFRYIKASPHAEVLQKLNRGMGPDRDDRQAIARDFGLYSKKVTFMEDRNGGPAERVISGWMLCTIAIKTLERWCQSGASKATSSHVPVHDMLNPVNVDEYREAVWKAIGTTVRALWDDVLSMQGKYIRFQHDHYLKLFQLSKPVLPYDFVLLDEAQDTAPVTEDIVVRQADHALLVMVGDPSQAIYGFTGARDSMTRFETNPTVTTQSLRLSESWRFGEDIARAANAFLAHTGRDMRIVGRGPQGDILLHTSNDGKSLPQTFVCRTNFDVIEAALEAIAAGSDVDATSVDLRDVVAFLDGAAELKSGKKTMLGGLNAYDTWAQFERDVEDGVALTEGQRVGMMMLDKYSTEQACKEKIALIESRSCSEGAGVKVITIHKAKGGEWHDVSVRYESAFRKVKDERGGTWWEIADPRLAYVAVTRAIEVLDPGHLWPVVEYGIVCEPNTLLAAAKRLVATLTSSERESLANARNSAARTAWTTPAMSKRIIKTLTDIGVRNATLAVPGFVRLMRNVLRQAAREAQMAQAVAA